ncbi:MAG: hypothetical protein LBR93_00565 [Treponema sp.]|nr:hypothetical protein [Treponema sp.]
MGVLRKGVKKGKFRLMEGKNGPRTPNCLQCSYFKVTWDPVFPRSCLLFGIKCRNLPSAEVFRASGRHCPSWQKREGAK